MIDYWHFVVVTWASSVADCLVVGRVVVAVGSAVVDVPAFVAVVVAVAVVVVAVVFVVVAVVFVVFVGLIVVLVVFVLFRMITAHRFFVLIVLAAVGYQTAVPATSSGW